jgi:hypothetical protein
MTVNTGIYRRNLRSIPWLTLLVALAPALSGAAAPLNVPALDAAPLHASLLDGAPSPHASSGKTRIGRIFFSPAERRHRYAEKARPATDAPGANDTPRRARLMINGAVSSSTQPRAVWVNGTAIENSATAKSAWTLRDGSVWLRDGQLIPHLVRPGQAINPASGAIEDLLPAGSVTRR